MTKSVDKSFLEGYFYLLLSLKLFSRKKSALLKLPLYLLFYQDLINLTKSTLPLLVGHSLLKEDVMSYLSTAPLCCSRLSERTDYNLTNSNYNIRLNPYKVKTRIIILIWCSCVSEDTKRVLPFLLFVMIWYLLFYARFFPNLSRDFLTNIDWLLLSHRSIGSFVWFINPTATLCSNDILLNTTLISTACYWIDSR